MYYFTFFFNETYFDSKYIFHFNLFHTSLRCGNYSADNISFVLSIRVMSKKPPPLEASEASAKKNMNIGGLDLFFKKETDVHKASCDFVLKNHDKRVPLGFKYLREEDAEFWKHCPGAEKYGLP